MLLGVIWNFGLGPKSLNHKGYEGSLRKTSVACLFSDEFFVVGG
jgi:hypothetical protein